jgi:DnaJ-class molecular chaperone
MTIEDRLALAIEKLDEIAAECEQCDGTGMVTTYELTEGNEMAASSTEPCQECEDIREVIEQCRA